MQEGSLVRLFQNKQQQRKIGVWGWVQSQSVCQHEQAHAYSPAHYIYNTQSFRKIIISIFEVSNKSVMKHV